jgi:hypothetical protein
LEGPGDFANVPTCAPGTCALAGSLGSTTIAAQTYPLGSWAFSNGTSFDADFGTGGKIHLGLVAPVVNGQAATSVGTMVTPSEGPMPGSNLCLGDGTRLQLLDADASVEIRFIARCITGSCTTTPTALGGEIDGCCAK